MNRLEKIRNEILAAAMDLNYYGKRILDSKLEVAENLAKKFDLKVDGIDLVKWLCDNRPTAQASKKADNKPAANTMTGGKVTRADSLPVIQGAEYTIITGVQNNTAACPDTLSELERIAGIFGADIIAVPIHYNKNAFSAAVEDESEYFASEFDEYLNLDPFWLHDRGVIRVASDARVLPTAKFPVKAAATLNSGELVTVVPATKQQLLTLPRTQGSEIKEAWSTGCCTVYNYTETRAGAEAEVDHKFGGLLVVRYANNEINVVNLVLGDDRKIALGTSYEADPVVVLGDLHCEVFDPDIWSRTTRWLSELPTIDTIVVHDVLHFSTRSHHNRNSGKHIYANKGRTVLDDLRQVITQVNELAQFADVYVCESNHNSAIDNWLDDSGYKPQTDAHNAKLYYLLNWLICDAIDKDTSAGDAILALDIALQNADLCELPTLADNIEFGRMDKPKIIHGYDFSCHGHKGQNGSAGNTTLFSKWRLKMVTGHTHSPAIIGDVLTVGVTARLDQGYNRGGASSWANSHGIVYPNSTAVIVPMNLRSI